MCLTDLQNVKLFKISNGSISCLINSCCHKEPCHHHFDNDNDNVYSLDCSVFSSYRWPLAPRQAYRHCCLVSASPHLLQQEGLMWRWIRPRWAEPTKSRFRSIFWHRKWRIASLPLPPFIRLMTQMTMICRWKPWVCVRSRSCPAPPTPHWTLLHLHPPHLPRRSPRCPVRPLALRWQALWQPWACPLPLVCQAPCLHWPLHLQCPALQLPCVCSAKPASFFPSACEMWSLSGKDTATLPGSSCRTFSPGGRHESTLLMGSHRKWGPETRRSVTTHQQTGTGKHQSNGVGNKSTMKTHVNICRIAWLLTLSLIWNNLNHNMGE